MYLPEASLSSESVEACHSCSTTFLALPTPHLLHHHGDTVGLH